MDKKGETSENDEGSFDTDSELKSKSNEQIAFSADSELINFKAYPR